MTAKALRMTRRFDASPEAVFDSWVDPERVKLWLFAPPNSIAHTVDLDPRVGGKWRISDTRDGTLYVAEGEYLELDRPRKLVFTFAMFQFSPNHDTITVEIAAAGNGTLMTFTQAGVEIAAEVAAVPEGQRGATETGWHFMFLGLADVAQGRAPVIPPQSHV